MSHPPEPPPPNHGYGYGYGSPYGPAYGPHRMPTNGKATASLVAGVATLVLSLCPLVGLGGLVAVVLGVRARGEIRSSGGTQQGDGLALGGIITGGIAFAVGLIVLALVVVAVVAGVSYEGGPTNHGTAF
jgi:1,4-dihydroxy-2-naphthoate octaprenyltransferase